MQQRSYKQTWGHYENIRSIALQAAHKQLPNVLSNRKGTAILKSEVSLDGLDFETFQKLARWEHSGKRVAEWDWHDVRKKYKSHPKRFELSIWHKQTLSGASIGRPTWGGNKLRLDFIEANPSGSPLHGLITDIVVLAGRMYAEAIGATQLRIMHPVNEKVRDHYLSKGGFAYNQKGNFCYWNL